MPLLRSLLFGATVSEAFILGIAELPFTQYQFLSASSSHCVGLAKLPSLSTRQPFQTLVLGSSLNRASVSYPFRYLLLLPHPLFTKTVAQPFLVFIIVPLRRDFFLLVPPRIKF